MIRPAPRLHTPHAQARLLLWARVWIEMLMRLLPARAGLGPFAGALEPMLRARLRDVRAMTVWLVFLRAAARLERRRTRKPSARPLTPPVFHLRRVIGLALLRKLGRGELRAQIEALRALLRDPESTVARLVRRLRAPRAPPRRAPVGKCGPYTGLAPTPAGARDQFVLARVIAQSGLVEPPSGAACANARARLSAPAA